MIKQQITLQEAIDFLNEAFEVDPIAISMLTSSHVPCNTAMANHPTIQVGVTREGYEVGLLGILNGLFGSDEKQRGEIAAVLGEDGMITGFMRAKWTEQP